VIVSIAPLPVNAYNAAGSVWAETYNLTQPDGTPIDLTGLTFTFSIRPNLKSQTTSALVQVTSAGSNAQGSITVTPLAGTVAVSLTPAATLLLGDNQYAYTLWSNPDTTTSIAWVAGAFVSHLVAAS
jgi:hypothetical protein